MSPRRYYPFSFLSVSHRAALWLLCGMLGPVGLAQALGMPDLIELVVQSHPAIQSQLRLVQSAQADEKGAEQQFYPTPSISVERVSSNGLDTAYANGSRVSTLRLQQPLWTGGRLTAGLERAQAASELALASSEEVRQQMALRTIQAWGDWFSAQQKTQALQDSLKTHEALTKLIAKRIEVGVSSVSDEVLAQGRLQQTLADLNLWKSQQAMSKARLEQLLGRQFPPDFLTQFEISPRTGLDERADLVDLAWTSNPGLRKLQAQVQVQEKELAIRKSRVLPEVYLRAERQMGSYLTSAPPAANRLFVGLSASLGAGTSSFSEIEAAQARLEALLQEIESSKRLVEEQVRTDQLAVVSLAQRAQSLTASLSFAQSLVDSWDRQFLAGRKSWVELMNAARDLAQSQTALADVQANLVVSSWRLAVNTLRFDEILNPTRKAP